MKGLKKTPITAMIAILLGICLYGTASLAASPQRIVSVGGAITEILYALDAQDRLVAADTTSRYPAAAESVFAWGRFCREPMPFFVRLIVLAMMP